MERSGDNVMFQATAVLALCSVSEQVLFLNYIPTSNQVIPS
jgi:hypothetical protein